jgi:hypothetical protein
MKARTPAEKEMKTAFFVYGGGAMIRCNAATKGLVLVALLLTSIAHITDWQFAFVLTAKAALLFVVLASSLFLFFSLAIYIFFLVAIQFGNKFPIFSAIWYRLECFLISKEL